MRAMASNNESPATSWRGTAGAPGAIRTRNLRIRSPTLCPIELRGQYMIEAGSKSGHDYLG